MSKLITPPPECKYGMECYDRKCMKGHFHEKRCKYMNHCLDESCTRRHPNESHRMRQLHDSVAENKCKYGNKCLDLKCDKKHSNYKLLMRNRISHIAGACFID